MLFKCNNVLLLTVLYSFKLSIFKSNVWLKHWESVMGIFSYASDRALRITILINHPDVATPVWLRLKSVNKWWMDYHENDIQTFRVIRG